ncbi:MAG: gyrase inhibitor YacG [Pseudomonadota bacterium]|jgi:endogenous inhibitor of DNA gyrase (YacG/DUF329 family)
MTDKPRTVMCPGCQKQVEWSADNPYRPFCSQRCRLIDFGEWASGRHAIAGESIIIDDNDEEPGDWRPDS